MSPDERYIDKRAGGPKRVTELNLALAGTENGAVQPERIFMGERKGGGGRQGGQRLDVAFDPIAAALRQMHDKVAQEDIPDDFLRLLDEIDERASRGNPQ